MSGDIGGAFLTAAARNLKRLAATLFAILPAMWLVLLALAAPQRRIPARAAQQPANRSDKGQTAPQRHPRRLRQQPLAPGH